MFHATLITIAGAALLAPTLVRKFLWWRANRPTPTYTPGRIAIEGSAYVVNLPEWASRRDWLSPAVNVNARALAPDYEGLHTAEDGADWIRDLVRAGHSIEIAPAADLSRQATLLANAEFERFDRMTSRGMAHVDTICSATIERWQREWDEWQAIHPSEATALALHDTREWIAKERGAVTAEFERIMLAQALLVS